MQTTLLRTELKCYASIGDESLLTTHPLSFTLKVLLAAGLTMLMLSAVIALQLSSLC